MHNLLLFLLTSIIFLLAITYFLILHLLVSFRRNQFINTIIQRIQRIILFRLLNLLVLILVLSICPALSTVLDRKLVWFQGFEHFLPFDHFADLLDNNALFSEVFILQQFWNLLQQSSFHNYKLFTDLHYFLFEEEIDHSKDKSNIDYHQNYYKKDCGDYASSLLAPINRVHQYHVQQA